MQSVKALLRRRSLCSSRFRTNFATLSSSSQLSDELVDDRNSTVLVETKAGSKVAVLNRPSVLNCLNNAVAAKLQMCYKAWDDDPNVGFVTMKGNGRAFCAGGDLINVYHFINNGNAEGWKNFFRRLNSFLYNLGTYSKPTVALLNGITMGGGSGVSTLGTFRVATNRTIYAIPETQIGYHPDAAASFYLSRLPGYIGEYLALTGEKINGAEMLACGLATHYTLDSRIPVIEEELGKLVTDDPSEIKSLLEKYAELAYPDEASVMHRLEVVDSCFSRDTVEEIIDALENEASATKDKWCIKTVKTLKEVSPLSLKVTLRSIREGRFQTLAQCLTREYRMTLQCMSRNVSHDFTEGVRARLVDKDSAPKWDPPTLGQVSDDMVETYFSRLSEFELDLDLPTKIEKRWC